MKKQLLLFFVMISPIFFFRRRNSSATSEERDFVHVLSDTLKRHNAHTSSDLPAINIAHWEQNFKCDFSKEALVNFKPDILIIRLGENVNEEYTEVTVTGNF